MICFALAPYIIISDLPHGLRETRRIYDQQLWTTDTHM